MSNQRQMSTVGRRSVFDQSRRSILAAFSRISSIHPRVSLPLAPPLVIPFPL